MPDLDNRSHSIPLSELERYQDAEWVLHDPEVQRQNSGQWVVAYKGKIIAAASDPREVVTQANRLVPGLKHLAVFCATENSDCWLDESGDRSFDFTDG